MGIAVVVLIPDRKFIVPDMHKTDLFWIVGGSVIVAWAHLSIWLPKESWFPLGESMLGLFFIPLLVAFFTALILNKEDFRTSLYGILILAIIATVIILVALLIPLLVGVAQAVDIFAIWTVQRVALSILFMLPASFVGGFLGGIISSY